MSVPGEHETPVDAAGPQRLYLHVGLPKSGSTYLQAVLADNRELLKEHGFLYPYVRHEGMFVAAVEMVGSARRWGFDPDGIAGTFEHLLRRGRRVGGRVVISHEIFSFATREQVATMAGMLEGYDVHLVVSARDLGRTATAEWQEQVKNGDPLSFADFISHLLADLPEDPAQAPAFWRSQNLVRLFDRWSIVAPPEKTHLVTCPRSGAPQDLLWERFADAIGLAPHSVDLSEVTRRNESLGVSQIALLRDVLVAVGDRLEQPWHSRLVKRWFAQTLLTRSRSQPPITPPEVAERLRVVSQHWIDVIGSGGYQVHGDLAELLPDPADAGARHPDEVDEEAKLDALPEVLAEMLVRVRGVSEEAEGLTAEVAGLTAERDRLAARVAELEGTWRLPVWLRRRRTS